MAGGGLYSTTVRWLKLALPAAALGLVAAVLLINERQTFEGGLHFTKADLEALGAGLKVSNPNLSGVTRQGDEYNFYAREATPSDLEMSSVGVVDLKGTVQLRDSIRIYVTAPTAQFNLADQQMNVPDGAKLATSDGYTFRADRLTANLETAELFGEGAIEATGPMGDIRSDRIRIAVPEGQDKLTENPVIWLEDNVKLLFDPATVSRD
jgi:lipopolysaccharide export system protein LptC